MTTKTKVPVFGGSRPRRCGSDVPVSGGGLLHVHHPPNTTAKPHKRTAPQSSGVLASALSAATNGSVEPGPVDESHADHAARHPCTHRGCARCVYNASRIHLERSYGSYVHDRRADDQHTRRTVWLHPRPVRLGCTWGVGCVFCASLRQKHADARSDARRDGVRVLQNHTRGPNYADTRWSRFEIRSATQIASRGIRQHADTRQHKLAIRAYFAPDDALQVVESIMIDSQLELFRGGVPQVEDWLRAWRSCRTPQSFAAAEANGITETFIKCSRVAGANRKAFRAMVRIMALVLRARKLRALQAAKSISLVLDDRGSFRLVSFRCCMDAPVFGGSGVKGHIFSGCLAVLRRGGAFSSKELAHADEDYSRDMSESVVRGFRRIAQCPRLCVADPAVVEAICKNVRIAVADGGSAAQKCLKFLAAHHMPNIRWCGRDRAHALRIATSGPLLQEKLFKDWWDDIFNNRHALVPDIQNSEEWLAKLELCQRQVLGCSGVQGYVDTVAKTLHFAKQRFDSLATPQLTFCAIQPAIAMLLAYVASDERAVAQTRARARRRLHELPNHVLTAGLSASYASEAISFVRKFDSADHDPALTYSQTKTFLSKMKVLFTHGRIWDCVDVRDEQTPLSLAWHTARDARPIYYDTDGKVLHLFRKPTQSQAQQLSDGIQAITDSMTKRVQAELSTDDVGVQFTAFDLSRWYAASCDMNAGDRSKLQCLERHAHMMFTSWKLDSGSGVRELSGMAFRLCATEEEHLRGGRPRDNREVWSQVLASDFRGPNDVGVNVLLPMLCVYICATDSTCGVERDLGALTRVLAQHAGPLDDDATTIAFCTEVLLDGPDYETGLATNAGGSGHVTSLIPSEFTCECARMWVDHHGRRFCVYKKKLGRPPRPSTRRPKTFVSIKRGAAHAIDKLSTKGVPPPAELTMLGLPRSSFMRPSIQTNPASKPLKKFDSLTKKKRLAVATLAAARNSGVNPYTIPGINPNEKIRKARVLATVRPSSDAPVVRPGPGCRIPVLTCVREHVPERDGYRVTRLELQCSGVVLVRSIKDNHMVLLDSVWAVDHVPQLSELLTAVTLAVVALGKPVLPRSRWSSCRPSGPTAALVIQFRPIFKDMQNVMMTDKFRRDNPLLASVIGELSKLPGSKWKLCQSLAGIQGTRLDVRHDARDFVLSVRRVEHRGGGLMGGGYFPTVASL